MYISLCAHKVFVLVFSPSFHNTNISLTSLEGHTENTLVLFLQYYHVCNVLFVTHFMELKYPSEILGTSIG